MKEQIREVLKEQDTTYEEDALNLIVRNANGGMRDALGILEQLMAGSGSAITAEAAKKQLGVLDTDAILNTLSSIIRLNTAASLSSMEDLLSGGKSPSLITETSLRALTDMITMKSTGSRQSVMHSRDYIKSIWQMGQKISFNRLYWLCEQFCDLRTAIRGSADPALDLKLTLIRLSHQEIVSSDTVRLAEEISMLKKELAQLKNMICQGGVISTQEEAINQQREDNPGNTAEDAGFHENPDMDIPFENEERAESGYGVEMPKEDEKPQDAHDTEGGMQTDREEAEVISTDLKPGIPEEDITASDLFKILR